MDIIVIQPDTPEENIKHIFKKLESKGLSVKISRGTERTIIHVIGDTSKLSEDEELAIRAMTGVENVLRILKPYKLVSREVKPEDTVVQLGDVKIGGSDFTVIAGPCAVESLEQCLIIARAVKKAGARLRYFVLLGGRRGHTPSDLAFTT